MNNLSNLEQARILYARLKDYAVISCIEKCEKEDTPDNREIKAFTEGIEVGLIDTAVDAYLKKNYIETIFAVDPVAYTSGTHTCQICRDHGFMVVVKVAYNFHGSEAYHTAMVCRRCFNEIEEQENK